MREPTPQDIYSALAAIGENKQAFAGFGSASLVLVKFPGEADERGVSYEELATKFFAQEMEILQQGIEHRMDDQDDEEAEYVEFALGEWPDRSKKSVKIHRGTLLVPLQSAIQGFDGWKQFTVPQAIAIELLVRAVGGNLALYTPPVYAELLKFMRTQPSVALFKSKNSTDFSPAFLAALGAASKQNFLPEPEPESENGTLGQHVGDSKDDDTLDDLPPSDPHRSPLPKLLIATLSALSLSAVFALLGWASALPMLIATAGLAFFTTIAYFAGLFYPSKERERSHLVAKGLFVLSVLALIGMLVEVFSPTVALYLNALPDLVGIVIKTMGISPDFLTIAKSALAGILTLATLGSLAHALWKKDTPLTTGDTLFSYLIFGLGLLSIAAVVTLALLLVGTIPATALSLAAWISLGATVAVLIGTALFNKFRGVKAEERVRLLNKSAPSVSVIPEDSVEKQMRELQEKLGKLEGDLALALSESKEEEAAAAALPPEDPLQRVKKALYKLDEVVRNRAQHNPAGGEPERAATSIRLNIQQWILEESGGFVSIRTLSDLGEDQKQAVKRVLSTAKEIERNLGYLNKHFKAQELQEHKDEPSEKGVMALKDVSKMTRQMEENLRHLTKRFAGEVNPHAGQGTAVEDASEIVKQMKSALEIAKQMKGALDYLDGPKRHGEELQEHKDEPSETPQHKPSEVQGEIAAVEQPKAPSTPPSRRDSLRVTVLPPPVSPRPATPPSPPGGATLHGLSPGSDNDDV